MMIFGLAKHFPKGNEGITIAPNGEVNTQPRLSVTRFVFPTIGVN